MYRLVHKSGHPRSNVTGLVPVYILTAEKQLGRPLEKGELVHHKDFNKLNDSEDNLLFPITRKEHQQLPAFQARFILSKGLYVEFLVWWYQEKDKVDNVIELERKLVKAQNERERLRGRVASRP